LPTVTELMDKFHEEVLTEPENNLLCIGMLLLVEMQQYDLRLLSHYVMAMMNTQHHLDVYWVIS
jgi:hypothetical protein